MMAQMMFRGEDLPSKVRPPRYVAISSHHQDQICAETTPRSSASGRYALTLPHYHLTLIRHYCVLPQTAPDKWPRMEDDQSVLRRRHLTEILVYHVVLVSSHHTSSTALAI